MRPVNVGCENLVLDRLPERVAEDNVTVILVEALVALLVEIVLRRRRESDPEARMFRQEALVGFRSMMMALVADP